LPEDRWGPGGVDAVEFLIATNPGSPFALGKIASGGELSRFILALKVALAEEGGAATVIFDEIDRGSVAQSPARSANVSPGLPMAGNCWP
jgi:DNA repair protein RecN (Recombination protein N)